MHSQLCKLQSESFRSKGRLWIFLPLLEHAGSTGSEQGAPPGHSSHLCCRPCAGCPGPCAAGPGRIDTMTCPGLSGLASHALRCPPHILTVSVRCLPKHRWLPLVQARCRASCRKRRAFFAPFTSHGNCTSTSVATTFHWVLLLSPRILRVRPSRPLTLCPPCLAWLAARVKSAPTRPPCLALLTSLLQPPPYDAHNAHPSAPCSLHLTAPGLVTTLQARSKVLCKGCHAYPRHAGSWGRCRPHICVSPRPAA